MPLRVIAPISNYRGDDRRRLEEDMHCHHFKAAIVAAVVCSLAIGCKGEPKKVWVEDPNPPVFGSTAALKTWPGFMEGKWGLKSVMDMELAKQLGVSSIASEQADEPISSFITFKGDGTFTMKLVAFGYKVGGHWQANAQQLQISYETFDGKPIAGLLAEAKVDEERGGSVGIAKVMAFENAKGTLDKLTAWVLRKDGKALEIPVAPGEMIAVTEGGNQLVRMVQEKPDEE
jgi:hypothetical protein